MIELLAGPLIGDMLSIESKAYDQALGAAPLHGELIVIFDPERFLGQHLGKSLDRAEKLFDAIIGQGARLPSQRRYDARAHNKVNGLTIPVGLYDELMALTNFSTQPGCVRQKA